VASGVRKRWIAAAGDPPAERRLMDELEIGPIPARILAARGFLEPLDVKRFIHPRLRDLPHPSIVLDAERAARRIADAVEQGQRLAVYGDYDADGVTAAALLAEFFAAMGAPAEVYIPNRMEHGYGFNPSAAIELAERGCQLLITVDCGVNDHAAVDAAVERGVEVIVTDHHEIGGELPRAFAVLNPHRPGCGLHDERPAGVGVAFFLAGAVRQELLRRGWRPAERYELQTTLDLVALGAVADIVPLTGLNRIFVYHGLKLIDRDLRPGLAALCKAASVTPPVRCGDIAFRLAPRINAAGRLGDASIGVRLLLTRDPREAGQLARQLHEENARRQAIESAIFAQAQAMVEQIPRRERLHAIVLAHPEWHPGVIGVVASRMVDVYHRPTILLAAADEVARGSGRSIPEFNLYEALQGCAGQLEGFGGHAMAAGVQVRRERIVEFAKALDQAARARLKPDDLTPKQRIDAWCEIDQIDERLVRELSMLAPFGFGNPEPVLAARDVKVVNKQIVGTDHLKLRLPWGKAAIAVIAYGRADLHERIGGRVDLAFTPEFSHYGGVEHIQLRARDIALPDDV
jgi:single-stranded-DNA-specific exonuclease